MFCYFEQSNSSSVRLFCYLGDVTVQMEPQRASERKTKAKARVGVEKGGSDLRIKIEYARNGSQITVTSNMK